MYTSSLLTTGQRLQPSIQKYDGLGRVIRSTDPSGAKVDTTYDAEGRVYSVTNPYYSQSDETYGTTYYQYDILGRKKLLIQPDGNQSEQSWDYSGNSVTFTDEAQNQWQRTSDALGRLVSVLEPNGTNHSPTMETDYSYDALGNLALVKQWGGPSGSAGSISRTFYYDSLSRLVQAYNPEAGWICYGTTPGRVAANGSNCTEGYDANSNLTAKTDARGIEIDYSYDNLNRQTGKTYPNSSDTPITYTFDAHGSNNSGIGLRTGMTDASGSTTWTYDAMGRVLAKSQTIGTLTPKTTQSVYNLNGSVSQLIYPSGTVLQYSFDSAGRNLTANDTTHSIQYASNAAYNASGALTGLQLGQSITLSNHYQPRLQPTSISATTPSQTLLSLTYSYHYATGDNGDIYGITNGKDSTRSQSYQYDTLNRVRQAEEGSRWGMTFFYDPFGNLNQTGSLSGKPNPMPLSQTVNAKNQFMLGNYGYDGAGNVLADGSNIFNCQTNSSPSTYTFNAEGQIVCATGATYTYNGDGARVKKSNGKLYWGGSAGGMLAESDLSGNLTSEFIFIGGKRTARRDTNGSVYYFLSDHLGSTSVLTNAAGQIQNEFDFTPFGVTSVVTQNLSSQPYLFTGQERDTESGNDYFGARYYSSAVGRFMLPDPSQLFYADPTNPQSLNLYSYVLNNPLVNIDPSGLECVWDDGSYDAADDPDTGEGDKDPQSHASKPSAAEKCGKAGGKWIPPSLFENALLTNGNSANIQYGQWSAKANSTIVSSWLAPSATLHATPQNEITVDATGIHYQFDPNYNYQDPNTPKAWVRATPPPRKLSKDDIKDLCGLIAEFSAGGTVAGGSGSSQAAPSEDTPAVEMWVPGKPTFKGTAVQLQELNPGRGNVDPWAAMAGAGATYATCVSYVSHHQ